MNKQATFLSSLNNVHVKTYNTEVLPSGAWLHKEQDAR